MVKARTSATMSRVRCMAVDYRAVLMVREGRAAIGSV